MVLGVRSFRDSVPQLTRKHSAWEYDKVETQKESTGPTGSGYGLIQKQREEPQVLTSSDPL